MIVKRMLGAGVAAACAVAAACGDGGGRAVNIPCAEPGDSAVATAVAEYVRTLSPQPRRFLLPVAREGRLPDAAQSKLRTLGPTYLFPADSTQQRTVREQLAKIGSYVTVLVTYEGLRRIDEDSATVRFAARYVGGENDGTAAPTQDVVLVCDLAQWKARATDEERST